MLRFDLRVVAATNRDPRSTVVAGALPQDLFYRLNVVTLVVPPLRERLEDIPSLAASLLKSSATRIAKRWEASPTQPWRP
jgi:transcriptional regulator with PAS, ATPase and Fis domain